MWGNFLGLKMSTIFVFEMSAAIAILTRKFQQREHFCARVVICFGVLLIVSESANQFVGRAAAYLGFGFFIILFFVLFWLISFAIPICFQASMYDSLFCSMAAYAVQNSLYQFTILLEKLLLLLGIKVSDEPLCGLALLLLCHVVTYAGVYFIMGPLARQHYPVDKIRMTVLCCIMLVVVLRMLPDPSDTSTEHYIAWLFLHILVNLLSLYIMFGMSESSYIKQELDTLQKMWKLKEEHYEQSRQVTESINLKCHDLKYQISALRKGAGDGLDPESLREIENAVMIYDSIAKTGNDALDTILTEKSLFCEKNGIKFTYMADGKKLEFVEPMDIYVIFGNALDNAIESVMKIPQPERRIITLQVSGNDKILTIQLRNACAEELQIRDGLPLTSKQDPAGHGYGMKSIRILSRKYGGDMTFAVENGIFSMNILLNQQ